MDDINIKPLLSILIPTCNYKVGLLRILFFLTNVPKEKCEVIIFDNSPNDDIKNYMDMWVVEHDDLNIKYQLNRPVTTASENWNNLINASSGEYSMLLHNGEIPGDAIFFERLIQKLEASKPDLALVNCILVDLDEKSFLFHLPMYLKYTVVKRFPCYLFQRNVIGPASTLIIKKHLYAKFDHNLKWLLDVDSYYRSIKASKKVEVFNDLEVLSVFNKSDTLTSNLASNIKDIERSEKKYLSIKYGNILWLKNSGVNIALENIIWKIYAKLYQLLQINSKKVLKNRLSSSLQAIWEIK